MNIIKSNNNSNKKSEKNKNKKNEPPKNKQKKSENFLTSIDQLKGKSKTKRTIRNFESKKRNKK